MDLRTLKLPKEILDSINKISNDIEIDNYSDQGANGYVLFGNHRILKKRIALKYYYYGTDSHEEVQLLSNIKSNNILRIHNARTIENGWAYFMTDEISGGDLDNYLAKKNFGLKNAVFITQEILNGLVDLHIEDNRLLHRDLKPANILLNPGNSPLIADFGSVKKLPDGHQFVSGSKHAALYRPPEAYKDEYSFESDIYQVGIVLYQLLGGSLSYNGQDYLNKGQKRAYRRLTGDFEKSKYIDSVIEDKCKNGKLLDLKTLPHFVDRRLLRIIKKATNPNPKKRFSSATEFIHELHKLGTLSDWQLTDNNYTLSHGGKEYRIVQDKKGAFTCQKLSSSGKTWRKDSRITVGTQKEVVEEMMRTIK